MSVMQTVTGEELLFWFCNKFSHPSHQACLILFLLLATLIVLPCTAASLGPLTTYFRLCGHSVCPPANYRRFEVIAHAPRIRQSPAHRRPHDGKPVVRSHARRP